MGFPLIRPAIQPFFLRGVMLEELVGWPAIFWRSWGQHHQHHSFGLRGGKMTSRSTKNRANSQGWKFLLKRWEIQCEYVEIGCWFFSFLVPSIPVFKEPIFGTIPLKHLTEYLLRKRNERCFAFEVETPCGCCCCCCCCFRFLFLVVPIFFLKCKPPLGLETGNLRQPAGSWSSNHSSPMVGKEDELPASYWVPVSFFRGRTC